MAKIVKFCASCDESFAEKFGFCPNCGSPLSSYEMKPVEAKPSEGTSFTVTASEPVERTPAKVENVQESAAHVAPTPAVLEDEEVVEFEVAPIGGDSEAVEAFPQESVKEKKPIRVAAAKKAVASPSLVAVASDGAVDDGGFHITIVEEKNVQQRNRLLLGALILMVSVSVGTFFYSMFNLTFEVDAIDSDMETAYLAEVDPMNIDELKEEKAADKEGGGGGGGGKEQDKDASDGRLASQSQNPINPPTPMPQLTNPELPQIMETQGNNERPITNQPLGIPGALSNDPSSGRGSGGGLGDGTGTGQGTGRGTGEGSGIGSGSGGGNGDGDGDGDGDGPPKLRTGPTTGVKILSKPRAQYTDSARQQQIQGKVVLKVTFQSDGRIGAIVPVSGLGGGLTERAIAAARGISFEPAMKNGTPYSVTRTIEYTFTIY